MNIRLAKKEDFPLLYEIGKNTPEFQVSYGAVFMDAGEFEYGLTDVNSVFLLAEEKGKIVGFIYASNLDHDKPTNRKTACLIYLTVIPEFRKQGIAQRLYDACEEKLKRQGVQSVYGFANNESDGAILKFMEKNKFAKGHNYTWIDKEL